jgi:serine O-acetyltransferase
MDVYPIINASNCFCYFAIMTSTNLVETVWNQLRKEAELGAAREPLLAPFLHSAILAQGQFSDALVAVLSARLECVNMPQVELATLFRLEHQRQPGLVNFAALDLQAVIDRDPACNSVLEPFLFFKGFQALQTHRIAHELWLQDRRLPSLLLQSIVSQKLAVDIHPAALIGHGILLDHATGIVVGETATIGNNVSILHGVTLGGNGKEKGDRHPKVGDGVMIGAHAQLLGNIHIGKGAKVGSGAVVVDNVPAHITVAGVPAVRVGRAAENMPALEMNQNFTTDAVAKVKN